MASPTYQWAPVGGGFIEMTGWVALNQATPNTVGTLKPTQVNLFGNLDNDYAGGSSGVKLVYQLTKPQSTFAHGTLICGSGYTASAGSHYALRATWSPASSSGQCQGRVRARAILGAFDYTTTTWNSATGFTLSSAGTSAEIVMCDSQTQASVTLVNLFFGGTGTAVGGNMLTFHFVDGTAATTYGFLIEVMPKVTGQTNITLETAECFIDLMNTHRTRPRYYSALA